MPFPRPPRTLRAIGFDDAPFAHLAAKRVRIFGAVCAGTRFEGLVAGSVRRDGWNATDEIVRLLRGGKFLPQIHLVLIDGIAFGGFNVVDLHELSVQLGKPCVAVMRRPPRFPLIEAALRRLPSPDRRLLRIARAGPVHVVPPFVFQVQGAGADETADALRRLTDRGNVPEGLRLAHLIGAAVVHGESGRRA
ncbi:MAG: DUF99 family protein [Myxococcales bacterium]